MTKTEKTTGTSNFKYLLGFSLISEIGPARFKKISENFESIEQAWNSSETKLVKIFGQKISQKIIANRNKINLEQELELLKTENIEVISPKFSFKDFSGINNQYFPKKLQEIHSTPFILFARGELESLNKNQLAIVGSRRPTHYGRQVIERIF
jgi:DNA processing protein